MNSSTARIGYARVPTVDQNRNAQIVALKAAGCAMIRPETGSETSLESRPELGTILTSSIWTRHWLVTRINRPTRSLRDLQVIVARIKEKGAHLAATEQPVDTLSANGKVFFDMLGVFAKFETSLIYDTCRTSLEKF